MLLTRHALLLHVLHVLHLHHLQGSDSEQAYVFVSTHELVFLVVNGASHTMLTFVLFLIRLDRVIQASGCSRSLIHFLLRLLRIVCLGSCRFIPIVLLQELDNFIDVINAEDG